MDPTVEITTIAKVRDTVALLKSENATYTDVYQQLFDVDGCVSRLPRDKYAEFVASAEYAELMGWYSQLAKAYHGPKRMLTPRVPVYQINGLEAEAQSLKISVNQLILLKLSLPIVALAK